VREKLGWAVPCQSIAAREEFGLMERLLREHCEIVATARPPRDDDDDHGQGTVPVDLKKASESGSLQTPHDPDVT
jgi:hypothetical protein